MRTLEATLRDYDLDLLQIIARRWDADLPARDPHQAASELAALMLDPDRAAGTWARLSDEERGAMQMLHASSGRMTTAQFTRLFGEVREMGPARRKKETPYLEPVGPAEALYYRGLIATAFDQNREGVSVEYTYIPTDLRAALPFTASAVSETLDVTEAEPVEAPDAPLPVDDTAVDDVTTLLAYLQLNALAGPLRGADQAYLRPHLLGSPERARLALLLNLIGALDLVAPDEGGVHRLARDAVRAWLGMPRWAQVRDLAQVWCESQSWNDLRYVPGLIYEEQAGAQNDPLLARQAILHFLAPLSPDAWWGVEDFVATIQAEAPDFQRPTGEWDSWYIRDEATGDYLRGFESWDRVDGALIRFLLTGPMAWLGLVQIDEAGEVFRLTEAGLAALDLAPWDGPDTPGATLAVADDGTVTAPRALNRYDRFTLARVTDWVGALDDGFVYRFSAGSLRRAREAGIEVKPILGFLRRTGGGDVPASLVRAMEHWAEGGAMVTITQAVILHTDTPDELERLQNEPKINRYLGRKLADTVIEVLPGAWPNLARALQAIGVLPEVIGLEEKAETMEAEA